MEATKKSLNDIKKQDVTIKTAEYDNVPAQVKALYDGEVDAIVLNEVYRSNVSELEEYTEIEIIKNTSERGKKVTGKEEISKIISELKDNSESTKKESVSDEPTNTEDYICIKFYHDNADDSPSIVYLYKDKDDSFIEQPYSGIWKLKNEIFDNISENLIE